MSSVQVKYSSSCNKFSENYNLMKKLGEGTFSDVWLCVDRNNGREYAVKILKKKYGHYVNENTWEDISELIVANVVEKHPYLLSMENAFHEQETGSIYLITELMKRSLYDLLQASRGPLSDDRVKIYMYQLLEGLKYLHEVGFIHRDIKPENILLCSGDKVLKIGDFGTAGRADDGQPLLEYVSTRWYRSPECLLTRGRYGKKMDVWAAGCVLFELGTGRPLFDGDDENDQMEKIDWVLGSPDSRLLYRFEKHKSDVFHRRYATALRCERNAAGVGLQSVYRPYKPGYDLLRDMVVYDPVKRFSADRLLRKSYFYDMKNTSYGFKIRQFDDTVRNKTKNTSFAEERRSLNLLKTKPSTSNKKQGPGGDRLSNLRAHSNVQFEEVQNVNIVQGPIVNDETSQLNDQKQDLQRENENIRRDNRKQNQSNVKIYIKNICPSKKMLTNSESAFGKSLTVKNSRKDSMIKRPPFK